MGETLRRICRSAMIRWCFFVLFLSLAVMWCAADVKPYPAMKRDWAAGFFVQLGLAALFFVLAMRAKREKNR